jgi:hypothetical protein
MQDFRTLIVCPNCGETDRSALLESPESNQSIENECVLRRCLTCLNLWWVDWSPAPAWATSPSSAGWGVEGGGRCERAVTSTPARSVSTSRHRIRLSAQTVVKRPSGF